MDETMVRYFGKHGYKQLMKGKPIRYGYKLWTGATSSVYIVWTDPYLGVNTIAAPEYRHLGLGASVVLQYVDVLSNVGPFKYHIFTDNFFTSLPFLAELRERNIKGTGTIRKLLEEQQLHRQGYVELDHVSFGRRLATSVLENNATSRKSNGRSSKNEHQDSIFDRKDHWDCTTREANS
ncbi:hypothetical protein PR048_017207 [Dryococelus australis]|uniref:PiggyBac transposable element-derived protein domain-containing protein n=1 Tax=Dryococelus australis TaxID=614101 RepID=A0ABQ9H8W4_9NEOP|nr:hypothetical protein PR048_017207 [Dryococelus australis]